MNTNDSITGETPEDPRKGWVSLADFPVDSYVLQFVEMADSWSSFYLRFALLDYEMKTVEFHPGQKMIRINKKEHMLTTESVARILETLATLQDQKKEADVSAQEIPKAIEPIQQGVKSNVDGLELGLDAPRGWVRLRGLPESLPISLTDDYGVTAKYICTTDQRSVEVDFPSRKLCLNGKIVYGTLTSSTIRLLSQYIPRSDEEIARGATSIRFGEGKEAPVDAHAPRDAEGSPEAPHASTGAPHAHPSGSSREDLKPEKFGGSGLTIKAIGIGGWRDWVRGYRELREKGSVATAADNTARFSIGGGIAYGAAEVSKYLGANWISMGFAPMKFGWIPGIGAIIGGGTLLARAGADKARYERWVRQKFEQTARDAKLDTETEEQALEYIRAQIEKNCDIHSNKLLNDDAEQHIIQALHKSGIAKPALAPYLGSEKQYAEYCFTQLTALCAAASVEHANIAGLNHHEVDALKKYHLETAEDKEAIRKSLVEMCNVYARLVGGYHRDKRESQVYGAVIGASLSMAGQSGGLSIVGGGLLLGARRMWVENKKSKLHIELDSKGDLVGKKKGKRREHVVSPELSRGEFTLVDHDVFHASAEMKAADLPDRAKKWLPKLVLPHHLHDMEFANAEQMGQEASAEVMSNLKNQTNLKKPGTPFEIEQAQKASDAEAQMLRELEKELRELPDKLDDAQAQFRKADSSLGATGPEERARR
ncbi:MAG TPA: hypothetical protein VI873_00990, partial [Candidatus Peribacteraceae bacterium]|nr:hypothetical protein [Candidatus Peribacteraceae bacterium]